LDGWGFFEAELARIWRIGSSENERKRFTKWLRQLTPEDPNVHWGIEEYKNGSATAAA
jgi:hypothetical protein